MEPRGNGAAGRAVPILSAPSLTDQWRAYLDAQRQPEVTVVELVLPSGLAVRATRPSLLHLMRGGRIPDALAGRVEELIATAQREGAGGVEGELDRHRSERPADFTTLWLNLLDLVWVEAVVEPRFGHAGESPDVLAVEAVPLADKTFLFVWAQGVDQSVAEFRDRQARPAAVVGVAPAGEGVRPGPGVAAGDRREA